MIESPQKLPDQAQPIAGEGRPTTVWWQYLFHLDDRVRKLIRAFSEANGDGAVTVANLPAASSVPAGSRRFVTDANATTFMSTVAGGGSNKVPVVSDGANWKIG